MSKFKLSKNISLTGVAETEEFVVPPAYRGDYYILYDKRRDKDFLINSTVKYFIDKFSLPATQEEVLQEIASDVQGDKTVLEETCSTFFKFLCNKKILLPEERDDTFYEALPLYNEGDKINDDLEVLEVLSDRKCIDVYRAVNKKSGSVYVIKLLNGNKVQDEKNYRHELSELEREYHTLKNLDHIATMCKAYGFTKEGKQYAYITLEYIPGKSLSDYLDETEALDETDCHQIIGSILQAFSLLHSSNVIHGDIHSSNILVLEDKSIKIIDVGLSRNIETDKNEVLNFGGVNFYMPPERINITSFKKYLKEPDLYSDVYQIGLLMYLILYNTLPFDGFIWEELSQNIKEGAVIYPARSFLNFPVSDDLITVLKKCLNTEPSERYGNAAEILSAFEKYASKK